jgi:hypothetical protein
MIDFTETIVNRWSRPEDASGTVTAGEEVFLPAGADSIAGPGSPSGRAEGGAPWRPRTAGIWRVAVRTPDGPDSHFVGVNPPIKESDPAMLDAEGLARLLVTGNEQVVDTFAGWEEVIFASRTGRPVFWLLIVAALTALAMEAWLAAPRPARSSDQNGAAHRA